MGRKRQNAAYCGHHCCEEDGCYKEKSSDDDYCRDHRPRSRPSRRKTWRPEVGDMVELRHDTQNRRRGAWVPGGNGKTIPSGRVERIGSCGEYEIRFSNVPRYFNPRKRSNGYIGGKTSEVVWEVTMLLKLEEIRKGKRRRLASTVRLTPLQELANLISGQ